ncbi:hypothetical protein PM082_004556 [Marasmius tenuissimus]|nr:hypothetical protein PM082_004556 [Marasmius tenuissimus]
MRDTDEAKQAQRIREALAAFHWGNGHARAISDDLDAVMERSERVAQELDESYGKLFHDIDPKDSGHSSSVHIEENVLPLSDTGAARPPSPREYSDPELDAAIASLSMEDVDILCSDPSSQENDAFLPQATPLRPEAKVESSPTPSHPSSSTSPPSSQSFPGSSKKKKKKTGVYLLLNGKNGFCGVVEEWHGLKGVSVLIKGAFGVIHRRYDELDEADQAYKALVVGGTGSVCRRGDLIDTIGYHNLTVIAPENIHVLSTEKEAMRVLSELLA